MARTTHGHHIPGTELDEEPYYPASICGGPYGCGQCIEETRKSPKHGGKVVPLTERLSGEGNEVGWVEIDESTGVPIGELIITDFALINHLVRSEGIMFHNEGES